MNELAPPDIWFHEIQRLKKRIQKLSHQEDLIVLYGSSSIRLWVGVKEDLAPYHVLNLGFGGSSYKWCVHFFDELFAQLRPAMILLYAGENDLSEGLSPEAILEDLQVLLGKIEQKYGHIPIRLVSIKPSPERTYLSDQIAELNNHLLQISEGSQHIKYIDIHHAMLDDNHQVQPHLYLSDGLHMNRSGYQIWKQVIKPQLYE